MKPDNEFWHNAAVESDNRHRHVCANFTKAQIRQMAHYCNLDCKIDARGMVALRAMDFDGITNLPYHPQAHEFMSVQDAMLRVLPQVAGECEFCAGTLLGESHSFACFAWRRIKGSDNTAADLPAGVNLFSKP